MLVPLACYPSLTHIFISIKIKLHIFLLDLKYMGVRGSKLGGAKLPCIRVEVLKSIKKKEFKFEICYN